MSNDRSIYLLTIYLTDEFCTAEQLLKLFRPEFHSIPILTPGPRETSLLKAFEMKPETISVPFKYLQSISSTVTEYEQRIVKKVQLEAILDQRRQPIYRLAHISCPACKIYAFVSNIYHSAVSALQISINVIRSKPAKTLITYRPVITSIQAGAVYDGLSFETAGIASIHFIRLSVSLGEIFCSMQFLLLFMLFLIEERFIPFASHHALCVIPLERISSSSLSHSDLFLVFVRAIYFTPASLSFQYLNDFRWVGIGTGDLPLTTQLEVFFLIVYSIYIRNIHTYIIY